MESIIVRSKDVEAGVIEPEDRKVMDEYQFEVFVFKVFDGDMDKSMAVICQVEDGEVAEFKAKGKKFFAEMF